MGTEGDVRLKPAGERSSFSLVVWRASLLTGLQPKASGKSCSSASLLLLEDLLLWAGEGGVKKHDVNEQNTTVVLYCNSVKMNAFS